LIPLAFDTICGVDFSGAAKAGATIWVSRCAVAGDRLELLDLRSLEQLSGYVDRAPALAWLADHIGGAGASLWGIDFPFGLPVELALSPDGWAGQLDFVKQFEGGAYDFGIECIRRARLLGDKMHIRRQTDIDTKTPFDCYHYRIIYQTFHGMRDLLLPLRQRGGVAIVPFDRPRAGRPVVAESCPGSTLKRLALPHNNYKQPAGGPLTAKRKRTRHAILDGLTPHVALTDVQRRVIQRNPGGDALDAVIAAVGVWQQWRAVDHRMIANHARYPLEGFVYA
jgi:hypothetical protein